MKRRAYAVAILAAIGGCSSNSTDADNSGSNAVADWQSAAPAPPEPPPRRYDFKEGLTYGYIADVSEEDRKKGKAAGDAVMFTYHGNEAGIYRLRMVDANGRELMRYECTNPCIAIKVHRAGGILERIAYTPDSLIGSVYQDALNGLLEPVREPVKPPPSGWAGEYNGTFEGATGTVTIKDQGSRVAVSIGVGSERCAGGVDFTAKRSTGDRLVKRFGTDDGGNQCVLTLVRDGGRLTVEEDACSYYHGAERSFNGEAHR